MEKRWPTFILIAISFTGPIIIGWMTFSWVLSKEFRNPECFLEPNEGHWMTPTEAYSLLSIIAGAASTLALMIVGGILIWLGKADWKFLVSLIAINLLSFAVIIYINSLFNPGYIESLYDVCGRLF